jgi:hypothetical protein
MKRDRGENPHKYGWMLSVTDVRGFSMLDTEGGKASIGMGHGFSESEA